MTMLFIIVAIAFTVAMTLSMLRPFVAARDEQLSFELLDEDLCEIESLVARKVALVQALRDIEYDWSTNKISQEDYERFKRSCERQAIGVMRRLDAIHGGGGDWESMVDRAIDERLGADAESPSPSPAAESTSDSSPTPERQGADEEAKTSLGDCPGCATPLDDDDRFCSQCGRSVESASEESMPTSNGPSDDFDQISSSPTSEVAG